MTNNFYNRRGSTMSTSILLLHPLLRQQRPRDQVICPLSHRPWVLHIQHTTQLKLPKLFSTSPLAFLVFQLHQIHFPLLTPVWSVKQQCPLLVLSQLERIPFQLHRPPALFHRLILSWLIKLLLRSLLPPSQLLILAPLPPPQLTQWPKQAPTMFTLHIKTRPNDASFGESN